MNKAFFLIILLISLLSSCKNNSQVDNAIYDFAGNVDGVMFLPRDLSLIPSPKSYENEIIIPYEMGKISAEQALIKIEKYLAIINSFPPEKSSIISYQNCKNHFLVCAAYFARKSNNESEKKYLHELDLPNLKTGNFATKDLYTTHPEKLEAQYNRYFKFTAKRLFSEIKKVSS